MTGKSDKRWQKDLHCPCRGTDFDIILANVATYIDKRDRNPISAQSHLDYAVWMLSELCPTWTQWDIDIVRIITEARSRFNIAG